MTENQEDGIPDVDSSDNVPRFEEAKRRALRSMKNIEDIFKSLDDVFSRDKDYKKYIQEVYNDYDKRRKWFTDCSKFFEKEKLKVVIFGSTSSGKSTTINAILKKRLLPTGMGHVTNCIFQIHVSGENDQTTFRVDGDDGEEKVVSLQELDSRLMDLSPDSIVYITCPKSEYSSFGDVCILDCPGLDNSDEHDNLVLRHCADADVFVYVSDAKSTIRKTEVSFFKKIKYPIAFILFNFWDLIDEDERTQQRAPLLMLKHRNDAFDFLRKSNGKLTDEDFEDKVYFVSAREYLKKQEGSAAGLKQTLSSLISGIEKKKENAAKRFQDFMQFEKSLWKYTTDSALNTRFEARITKGITKLTDLQSDMESIISKGYALVKRKEFERNQKAQQKKILDEMIRLMKWKNLLEIARTYSKNKTDEKDEQNLDRYKQEVHSHLVDEIKNELQKIHVLATYPQEETNSSSYFKEILSTESEETRREFDNLLKEKNDRNMTFEPPIKNSLEYTWSFAPVTLWKKFRYSSYYARQSTTSTPRAIVQLGGVGGTAAGCAIAVATPIMIPVICVSATAGAAFMVGHFFYDKSQWSSRNKTEHVQEMCAANIHFQFVRKYGNEWHKHPEKLDKDLFDYLYEKLDSRCEKSTALDDTKIKMLQNELEKLKILNDISREKNNLEEFEHEFLRPIINVEQSVPVSGDSKL